MTQSVSPRMDTHLLSPEKLAGGLLVAGFDGLEAPREILDDLREERLAGVILFKRNIQDPQQLLALNASLQEAAPSDVPLILSVDQEGGRVQRLPRPWAKWPTAAAMGATEDPELLAALGRAMGRELAAAGFNVDFAPVLDTHTNPQNPIIGDRAFAASPGDVSPRALAFAAGLEKAGVAPCGKHFPGHGDTLLDSHLELPYVEHPEARLRKVELHPFRQAAPHLPALMTAHVLYRHLDPDHPATLSPHVIQGLLREELGFKGLVVSDDLEMKAVSTRYPSGELAVRCLRAGVDLLLMCRSRSRLLEARRRLTEEVKATPEVREVAEAAWRHVHKFRRKLSINPVDEKETQRCIHAARPGGEVDVLLSHVPR